MVKFSENDRDEYPKVADVLYDFIQEAKAVVEARFNGGTGEPRVSSSAQPSHGNLATIWTILGKVLATQLATDAASGMKVLYRWGTNNKEKQDQKKSDSKNARWDADFQKIEHEL